MQGNDDRYRLNGGSTAPATGLSGWLRKALATTAGVVLVVAGFVLSLLAFAAVATIGLMAASYLWWRSRELRRQMRETREHPPGGRVIEGEVIRD
jgi:Flp pilus assembly protein TadB